MRNLVLIFVLQFYCFIQKCFDNVSIYTPEQTLITQIQEKIASNKNIDHQCLMDLVNYGYFKASNYLFEEYFLPNQITLPQEIKKKIDQIKNDLISLTEMITYSQLENIPKVQPVIQWGQSKSHLLLFIKFSLRVDSPAFMNIKNFTVNFDHSRFYMNALTISNHKPLLFELDLPLYQQINENNSTYKMEAVGTMVVNITKQENVIWERLLLDPKESKKIKIWWEASKLHQKDMDQYFQLLEQKEDEDDAQEDKKKKKKKKSVNADDNNKK